LGSALVKILNWLQERSVCYYFPNHVSFNSLWETSSVTGQFQVKLVCDWQKFWVYLSQWQVTFVNFCPIFNAVTG